MPGPGWARCCKVMGDPLNRPLPSAASPEMTERQDGGGSRDVVADWISPGNAADAGNINPFILHGLITEGTPVLHQMNPWHHLQWTGWPSPLGSHSSGIERLQQAHQWGEGYHRLHLREGHLSPRLPVDDATLQLAAAQLTFLAHHALACNSCNSWHLRQKTGGSRVSLSQILLK